MKMTFRTLATSEYRGCPIYIRNVGEAFEYLVIIRGALYSANVVILKTPAQTLLRRDYTPKQLADASSYVLKMAQATVDLVLEGTPR